MKAVNVTIRIDEEKKRHFDAFCANVGLNMTTAINLYINTVLRTRKLPFPVTDIQPTSTKEARMALKQALKAIQNDSVKNGTDKMSMEEIDAEIAASRREKRQSDGKQKQC